MKKQILILFNSNYINRSCLSVINWGEELQDGKIEYLTNYGKQIKTRSEIINNNVTLCYFEDLDIKKSLYQWFKINPEHSAKEIVIDYGVELGEIFKGNCWHISLMINKESETLKVKPIFN